MPNSYLDSNGLKHYTDKLKQELHSHLSGYVPVTRAINGKALNSDITLNAIDIGIEKRSSDVSSISIGAYANANGVGSITIGSYANAGNIGIVIGGYSHAVLPNSISIGYSTNANGYNAIAIGKLAESRGNDSIAIGPGSVGIKGDSIAIGSAANSIENNSISIGTMALVENLNSIAIGTLATTSANNSTALGVLAACSEPNTIQLGSSKYLSKLSSRVALSVGSDERDKTGITPIDDGAVEFLNRIKAIRYVFNGRELYIDNDENLSDVDRANKSKYGMCSYDKEAHALGTKKGERVRVGVLAQEVQKALQEVYGDKSYANLVDDNFFDLDPSTIPEGVENKLTMTYENFIPFLIKAVQELSEKNKNLEQRIFLLEQK